MEAIPSNDSALLILAHQETHGFASRANKIVLFGLGKDGHVAWQDLRNTADSGADNEQVATGSFYQDGSKGFGQTGMQVYMTTDHDIANLFVAHGAEKSDSVMEDMTVKHLLEINSFWAGTCDYEAHIGMQGKNAWDGSDQQIGSFVVKETGDDDYGDGVIGA